MYQLKKRSFDEAIEDDDDKDYQETLDEDELEIYSETDGRASTEMGDTDDIVEKHRERNREHAKRTRLRKKALIDGMKGRLLELQKEYARLEQLLEESNTANILLCLSLSASPTASNIESKQKFEDTEVKPTVVNCNNSAKSVNIIDQLRNRVRAEAAQKLRDKYENLSGSSTSSNEESNTGTKPKAKGDSIDSENCSNTDNNNEDDNLNFSEESKKSFSMSWKNGDEISILEGLYKKDSTLDFEYQKRERNRMHARFTRDRKKLFTSRLMQAIQHLERQNLIMRNRLDSVVNNNNYNNNTEEEKDTQSNQNQIHFNDIKKE